jgi:hypothetical protein
MMRVAARRRRGSLIVPVLICFVLIMLVSAALLQLTFAERGLARQEERRLQSEWLAEAGLARAAAKLARDRGYAGEAWELSPKDLDAREPGRVTITVETPDGKPGERRVSAQADYPLRPELRARTTRSLVLAVGGEPRKEDTP